MYKFFLTFWHVLNCRCCRLTVINLEEFPGWLLFTWSQWMIFLAGCPRRDSPCVLHCYKSNWWANNWCLYIQCGSFWGWAIFQQNPSKTFYVIVFKLIFVNNDNNSNHLIIIINTIVIIIIIIVIIILKECTSRCFMGQIWFQVNFDVTISPRLILDFLCLLALMHE